MIRAVSRYGGTFDDVWLGKELHDWLLILPITAARLVRKKLQVSRPQYTAVSLPRNLVSGMLSSKVRHTHRRNALGRYSVKAPSFTQ